MAEGGFFGRINISMEIPSGTTCPSCHSTVSTNSYFCANCGKSLRDKPPAVSLSKQIIVYFVSLFLPPFGFYYAWKYLKQSNDTSKKIGIVAVILTIISTLAIIWAVKGFIDSVSQSVNSLNNLNF